MNDFNKISDEFFKKSSWPPAAIVAREIPSIAQDKVFFALYKELYFRHFHWRNPQDVTIYTRFDSWLAYSQVFQALLDSNDGVVLPVEWLYDIIDEFIFQFQAFSNYKTESEKLTDQEKQLLMDNSKTWNPAETTKILYHVALKGGVVVETDVMSKVIKIQKILGYFALVGLTRLQILIGDHDSAIKILNHLKMPSLRKIVRLNVCHVSVEYFRGFCQVVTGDFGSALQTLAKLVMYIRRTNVHKAERQYSHHTRSILKRSDKVIGLLSIVHCMCPNIRMGNDVRETMHQKMESKLDKMRNKNDLVALDVFEDVFETSCPPFTNGNAVDYASETKMIDATVHQTQILLELVRRRRQLPKIFSLLKLYKTLSLSKLVGLGTENYTEEDVEIMRRRLICLKFTTRRQTQALNSYRRGDQQHRTHYWLENDVVQIQQEQKKRHYGGFFIENIKQLSTTFNDLN